MVICRSLIVAYIVPVVLPAGIAEDSRHAQNIGFSFYQPYFSSKEQAIEQHSGTVFLGMLPAVRYMKLYSLL